MDALLTTLKNVIFDASYHRMMGHPLSETAELIYESYKDKLMVIPDALEQEVNIYEAKRYFVERELTPILKRIDPMIDRAEYEKNDYGEFVLVNYSDKDSNSIIIDVTADSFLAITNDVLEVIG